VILEQPLGPGLSSSRSQHRRARAGPGQAVTRPFCSDAALARGAGKLERGEGERRRPMPGCSPLWTPCWAQQASDSHPRVSKRRIKGKPGRYSRVSNSRRPGGRSDARASALPRRVTIFSGCRPQRRDSVELADWWERFQRADQRRAERMLRPDEARRNIGARASRAQAQEAPATSGAVRHPSTEELDGKRGVHRLEQSRHPRRRLARVPLTSSRGWRARNSSRRPAITDGPVGAGEPNRSMSTRSRR